MIEIILGIFGAIIATIGIHLHLEVRKTQKLLILLRREQMAMLGRMTSTSNRIQNAATQIQREARMLSWKQRS